MDTALTPSETPPGRSYRDDDKTLRLVSYVIALFWLMMTILMLLDIPEYLEELRRSYSPLETGMEKLGMFSIFLWFSGSAYLSGRRKRLGYPGLGCSAFFMFILSLVFLHLSFAVLPIEFSASGIYALMILLSIPVLTILHFYVLITLYRSSCSR
jgi:hypothetical protein